MSLLWCLSVHVIVFQSQFNFYFFIIDNNNNVANYMFVYMVSSQQNTIYNAIVSMILWGTNLKKKIEDYIHN